MWWQLLLLFTAGAVIASLAWSAIKSWFSENALPTTSYGELIKKKLSNGNYEVISGVFNNNTCIAKKKWVAKELDDDLKSKFGNQKIIKIEL